MSGVGEAAPIVGFVGFFLTQAQNCINGLEIIGRARGFATNADQARGKLELQRHFLLSWYEVVEKDVRKERRLLFKLNWTRVKDCLDLLELLLRDVDKLEKKYHLQLTKDETENIGEHAVSDKSVSVVQKVLQRLLSKKTFLTTAQSIDDKANPWLRLKWAFKGEPKFEELAKDVGYFVKALWEMVDHVDRDYHEAMLRGVRDILRGVISSTPNQDELHQLTEIIEPSNSDPIFARAVGPPASLGAIKIKRIGLDLDLSAAEFEAGSRNISQLSKNDTSKESNASESSKNKEIRAIRLRGGEVQRREPMSANRELALYHQEAVVIEWKRISPQFKEKLKSRVESLAQLLSKTDSTLIGSLVCSGFFEDIGTSRHGFVFKLPSTARSTGSLSKPVLTLYDRFQLSKPALTERMNIAEKIAWSIRQMHTAGWLHKAVRSENILFCRQRDDSNLEGPYIAGFGYSRAANPSEISEAPDSTPEINIYSHTSVLNDEGRSYRKAFDLYSLGLVLLEIGYWQPMTKILLKAAELDQNDLSQALERRDDLLRDRSAGGIMQKLTSNCPLIFCAAVETCLSFRTEEKIAEVDNSIETHSEILNNIRQATKKDT